MEGMDEMGFQVPGGHKDKGEWLVQQALRVPLDHKDKGEWLEQQALRVPLAQGVVGWSTQGGEKLAVRVSQELSWCMQGGLVEPITVTREEQPTTSACLIHFNWCGHAQSHHTSTLLSLKCLYKTSVMSSQMSVKGT